jgi:two-component system, sensor histidine kinase PdtaS
MKSILLVEDEALIALEEAQSLKRDGYNVHTVLNGEGAVEAVRRNPGEFDLILMDIDLGRGIDGTKAAQEILRLGDIPVVFLSSHTEKEIVDKTEKITSYGYVVKNSGDVVLDASIRMAFRLHEAHLALAASEEKYSKAFHTSPDSININRLSDGIYLAVNEGFTKLTGYTPEEVIGKSSIDPSLNIWVDKGARNQLVVLLKEHGEATNFEAIFRLKSGELRYGLMSARVLDIGGERCILSFTRDITDRRAAQEALAASNATLASLINAAPLAIIGINSEGIVQLWNPAAEKLFGWTAAEVIGHANPIVPPQKAAEFADWSAKVNGGQQIYEWQTLRQRKDGSLVDVTLSSAVVPAGPGQGPSRIAIFTDITENRRAADALRRHVRQEEILRRELQHRVKNNLSILSSLLALEAPRTTDPAAHQILLNTQSRLNVMARMYNHMNQSTDAGSIDLRAYIQDLAIPLVKTFSTNPSIVLSNRVAEGIQVATRQMVPLGLMLNELITNSLKYAYPSGQPGEIRVTAKQAHGTIIVSVEDDGAGFKPGICPQNTQSLGLLLVRSLADQIDGSVSFQSPPGVRAAITFPAVESGRR